MKELELPFETPGDGVPSAPALDPRARASAYLLDLANWLRSGEIRERAAEARRELQRGVSPSGLAV